MKKEISKLISAKYGDDSLRAIEAKDSIAVGYSKIGNKPFPHQIKRIILVYSCAVSLLFSGSIVEVDVLGE